MICPCPSDSTRCRWC
nr:hypothetical protein [Escherichia coli]